MALQVPKDAVAGKRERASSLRQALHDIEVDKSHHLTGPFQPQTPVDTQSSTPTKSRLFRPPAEDPFYKSKGLWNDVKTLRWMRVPGSAFKLLIGPIVLHFFLRYLFPNAPNPFAPMIEISYPIPDSSPSDPRYAKGWLDLAFVAYHIIVFSFIRQFTLLKIIHPIALRLGIRRGLKLERFGEQGYAMLYYGVMGFWGLYIMSTLPTWYYRTENYWIEYPYWALKPQLKRYYLMHFSYWLQQLVILGLKLEKPRKDYNELIAHHIVTIWLIGWSYLTNHTYIGNAVFVSMDIPDVFLALSKLCNYLNLERTKVVTFIFFFGIWAYFRHYLNMWILWSIWAEFDLLPAHARFWRPKEGVWMAPWLRYQMFVPVLMLQLLNLFWFYLMFRILVRAARGGNATDDRSDDEDDGKED